MKSNLLVDMFIYACLEFSAYVIYFACCPKKKVYILLGIGYIYNKRYFSHTFYYTLAVYITHFTS